jgi:hypothetical protein
MSGKPSDDEAGPGDTVAEPFKSHASPLIAVFLAFGGALLVLHYARVGYLPEIRWENSLSYLFALSLIGGGLTLLYGLLLFFPGVIWSEFLVFDAHLRSRLCYRTSDGLEPCLLHIARDIAVPFAIFMTSAHWAITAKAPVQIATTVSEGLALASIYLWWRLRKLSHPDPEVVGVNGVPPATSPALLVKYLLAFISSAGISLVSVVVISYVEDPHDHVPLLVLCTIVVIIANLLVAMQFRSRRMRAIVTSFLAAAVLLAAGEIMQQRPEQRMSARVLSQFGVDTPDPVTVVVDARGSEVMKRLGIPVQNDASGGCLEEVHILSRLGAEYFLRVGDRSFTLPKEMVVSWLREPAAPLRAASGSRCRPADPTLASRRPGP